MQISEQLISKNRSGMNLAPQGIVIHSTADPGATAQSERNYFNSGDRGDSAHYFVDWTGVIRCIPENEKAWHAGEPANSSYLSVELCEPNIGVAAEFNDLWKNAIEFLKWIKERYGWSRDKFVTHHWVTLNLGGTDHTDPTGFFQSWGRTFEQLIDTVFSEKIEGDDEMGDARMVKYAGIPAIFTVDLGQDTVKVIPTPELYLWKLNLGVPMIHGEQPPQYRDMLENLDKEAADEKAQAAQILSIYTMMGEDPDPSTMSDEQLESLKEAVSSAAAKAVIDNPAVPISESDLNRISKSVLDELARRATG